MTFIKLIAIIVYSVRVVVQVVVGNQETNSLRSNRWMIRETPPVDQPDVIVGDDIV